eukprot:9794369-Ditylum_brightwellii.AAC.1
MANSLASRQLWWIEKIAEMEERRLPRKFLMAWASNPWAIVRPQTTIWNTYLDILRMIGAIDPDNKQGCLVKWFPQITDDPKLWD